MKKITGLIGAAAVCALVLFGCSGGSSGSDDGSYEPGTPQAPGGTAGPGQESPGNPEIPSQPSSPENLDNPDVPDDPSVSYADEAAVLKAVLDESAYSSYDEETASSVTLTQEAVMQAADIFPLVQAAVSGASSFSAAQDAVNGALEESKKVLVAMAENRIAIEKSGTEPMECYYSHPENPSSGVYKDTVFVPVCTVSAGSGMSVSFSGKFDLRQMKIRIDRISADWDKAELFFSETETAGNAEAAIKSAIKEAMEEKVENADELLANIKREKAVYSSKLREIVFTDMQMQINTPHPLLNFSLYVVNQFDIFQFYSWSDVKEKVNFRGKAEYIVLDGSEM